MTRKMIDKIKETRPYQIEIFKVFMLLVVIAAIWEIVWPGAVLAYININILLIFWLIFGIMVLL